MSGKKLPKMTEEGRSHKDSSYPSQFEVSKINLRENKHKVPMITEKPAARDTQDREGVEIIIHRSEVQGKVDDPDVDEGRKSTVDYMSGTILSKMTEEGRSHKDSSYTSQFEVSNINLRERRHKVPTISGRIITRNEVQKRKDRKAEFLQSTTKPEETDQELHHSDHQCGTKDKRIKSEPKSKIWQYMVKQSKRQEAARDTLGNGEEKQDGSAVVRSVQDQGESRISTETRSEESQVVGHPKQKKGSIIILKPPRKEDIPLIKETVRKRKKNIKVNNVQTITSMFEKKTATLVMRNGIKSRERQPPDQVVIPKVVESLKGAEKRIIPSSDKYLSSSPIEADLPSNTSESVIFKNSDEMTLDQGKSVRIMPSSQIELEEDTSRSVESTCSVKSCIINR